MNLTHADTIKQQVELFETDFAWLKARHTSEQWHRYKDFIAKSMNAAAHATEKAGEVEEQKHEKHADDKTWCGCCGHNICRAQSRRQLDAHFGRKI